MDKQTMLANRDAVKTIAATSINTLREALQVMQDTIIARGGEIMEPLVNEIAIIDFNNHVAKFDKVADADKTNKQVEAEFDYFAETAEGNIDDVTELVAQYDIFSADFKQRVAELTAQFENDGE
ncbi:hypothetical protein EQG49_08090 [Periweissella cryptocerci]|uniref:Uncharacterized protein n=1 Tax=Periweissella cryptocerci TaxID=2506420 RepID=A0A4P6YUG6_9LACO|nr:hypothetical protein [Periweissella cryptocerci]QBO36429.1 hypothetical protein EQG49_08090 [Periweissella cryptocerci]